MPDTTLRSVSESIKSLLTPASATMSDPAGYSGHADDPASPEAHPRPADVPPANPDPPAPPKVRQAGHTRPAEHRTILIVDVEAFTHPRRNNKDQVSVRTALRQIMRQAFEDASISWDASERHDRGDGILVLIPAAIPKAPFVDHLPDALTKALRKHNSTHPAEEQIRLRMALHAGEVEYDDHGVDRDLDQPDVPAGRHKPAQVRTQDVDRCPGADRVGLVLPGGRAEQRCRGPPHSAPGRGRRDGCGTRPVRLDRSTR